MAATGDGAPTKLHLKHVLCVPITSRRMHNNVLMQIFIYNVYYIKKKGHTYMYIYIYNVRIYYSFLYIDDIYKRDQNIRRTASMSPHIRQSILTH